MSRARPAALVGALLLPGTALAQASPAPTPAPLPVPVFWYPPPPPKVEQPTVCPTEAAVAEQRCPPAPAPTPAAPPAPSPEYQRVEQRLVALPAPQRPATATAVADTEAATQQGGTSLQQQYGGVSFAIGVGYGTVQDASGLEGLSYGITGSLPLSRWVGIPIYLVLGQGTEDKFGAYQSGLRIGRSFFVDLLVGWVRTRAGDSVGPTTGGGLSAGYHIGLFGEDVRWGLLPQLYAGYPFSGGSAVIQGIVGLDMRVTEP